jgi:hypothetical protein
MAVVLFGRGESVCMRRGGVLLCEKRGDANSFSRCVSDRKKRIGIENDISQSDLRTIL